MNDGLIETFVRQAPYIGALLFIVMLFLKYITTRDKEHRDQTDRMGKAHAEVMRMQMDIIRENSTAMSRVAAMMERCASIREHQV